MSEVEDFRDELIDKLRQKNMELAMANLNIKFLLGVELHTTRYCICKTASGSFRF